MVEAAGLDSLAGLSLPAPDFVGSVLDPESDDFVVDSVFVSDPDPDPDESDPLDPLDLSELARLSWARVSVL